MEETMLNLRVFSHNHHPSGVNLLAKYIRRGIRVLLASKENRNAPSKPNNVATVTREQGVVLWFSDIKGYGFIKGQYEDNIFVHYSDIKGDRYSYRFLLPEQKVEFVVSKNDKGYIAKNVTVIE
jgi:cold shock CspA family protein